MSQPPRPVPSYRHPQAAYRITVDGSDITPTVRPRLESLTLTDNRGMEADQLDLVLDDSDGVLQLPRRGAVIAVSLGWAGAGLVDKGTYIVDDIEHAGAPDKLTIRAKSADLRKGLTEKQEKSFHAKTFGDIVAHVAKQHGLAPVIGQALAAEPLAHVDQTGESDANMLTRLAGMLDAIVTVKAGKLLVFRPGEAVSATGKALPEVIIERKSGDSHRFSVSDRENYDAVEATYTDTQGAQKGTVVVEAAPVDSKIPETTGGSGKKVIRHVYSSKKNAERAAKAAMSKHQRGVAEFSITLALGRPELFPEIPATVKGFKKEIDSSRWIITKVTHNLTADGGYTMPLELELRIGGANG
jgi:phage protein D